MSMNDTVANFLTKIRNACSAGHESVQMRHTVLIEKIANVLQNEGYIEDLQIVGEGLNKNIVIKLKYSGTTPVISNLSRVSKPSGRIYIGYREIKPVMNGLGLSILSTPEGVMTDTEARRKRLGGEIICNVW